MKTTRRLAACTAFLAPAVLSAPRADAQHGHTDVDQVVADCRATGLTGWALVDRATTAVHDAYDHHSMWHLWETPAQSLQHGRGWSAQYNQALAEVLHRLGFRATVVHAARVRGLGRAPWWQAGHTWVVVEHDGRSLDVCASRATNTAGNVPFEPSTEVRPIHRWTRSTVSAALAPVVAAQAWRQLFGAPTPRWLYRRFDEPL